MKFGYSYRTSANVRAEGTEDAPSREALFAALRARGIRPVKVWPVDAPAGAETRRTPRPQALRRALIVCAVALAAIAGALSWASSRRTGTDTGTAASVLERQQLYGDPVLMVRLARGDFADIFSEPVDRILARHAQPGVTLPPASDRRVAPPKDLKMPASPIADGAADAREVRELKAVVRGMRAELARFVSDGGTLPRYVELLGQRQEIERETRARIVNRFEAATSNKPPETVYEQWLAANAMLKSSGLRPMALPPAAMLREYPMSPDAEP